MQLEGFEILKISCVHELLETGKKKAFLNQIYCHITQLLFQQNALVLLKAQDITICTFCLFILSPYMFQPAWAIFRGRNASA
jgi:hypothetical protein